MRIFDESGSYAPNQSDDRQHSYGSDGGTNSSPNKPGTQLFVSRKCLGGGGGFGVPQLRRIQYWMRKGTSSTNSERKESDCGRLILLKRKRTSSWLSRSGRTRLNLMHLLKELFGSRYNGQTITEKGRDKPSMSVLKL